MSKNIHTEVQMPSESSSAVARMHMQLSRDCKGSYSHAVHVMLQNQSTAIALQHHTEQTKLVNVVHTCRI